MTSEERLRRAEILLETAARYINRHEENINRLNVRMLQLVDMFAELATIYVRQNQEQMRRNQEEIERLWQYLTGQQGNGRTEQSE